MNPRLWSCRTFAALWGVLFAPLAPAVAETRDIAELLPADTLAYAGWAELYDEDDPDLQQARRFVAQAASAESSDRELSRVAQIIELCVQALQAPGGIALLDVQLADEGPDVQAALLLAAGEGSSKIAQTFHELMRAVLPDAEIKELSVADVPMRSLHVENTPLNLVWGTHQGYFLLTLGPTAAEKILGRLSGAGGPSLADGDELKFLRKKVGATGSKWRFSAYGDVRGIVAKARSLVEQMRGPLPPLVDDIIEALGINAIRSKYIQTCDSEQGPLTHIFVHVEGERKGILRLWAQQPLSKDDLKIVPKDAYWAQVWNLDLQNLWQDVRGTIEEIDPNMLPMVEGSVAMASGLLGLPITDQLLPALGDTWAIFDAPDHGGILLTGSVLVVEVRNADAVHAVLGRLVEILRPILLQKDVNLSLKETTCDGRTIHHVVVGGVPVPVAPAWTFVGDRMVFGLFPQTVAVAAKQVDPKTRRDSILDHPTVGSALQNVFPEEIQSFGYADAQYFARLFYPLGLLYATAATSMLSVPGVELDPTIFPILAEAVKDVHNSVGMGAADDDGIHYAQVGSANAGLAAVAVVALLVSILLPSLSRARELAKRAVSAANLRSIGMGMHIYANDHAGKFPENLEVLIEGGMIVRETLVSPRHPDIGVTPAGIRPLEDLGYVAPASAPAGGGQSSFIYINGQTGNDDVRNVLAYEKIIGDEGTNVLFVDGHVEWMKLDGFKRTLLETYQRLGRESEMPADLRP